MELQVLVDAKVQACLPGIIRKWNLQGMPHLLTLLKTLVGPPPQTVAQVCTMNAPILLQQILAWDELEPDYSVKRYPEFRRWQFNEGMTSAIRGGYLEVVEVLLASFSELKVSFDVVNTAALYGRLEIMKLLFAQRATPIARAGINVDQDAEISDIIDEPHPDFVKSSGLVGSALEHGHLELAQWLLPRVDKVSATWLHAAIKGGSLEAVQWVYTLSCRLGSPPGIIDAAVEGNTEILRLLLDRYDGYVDMAVVVSCEDYDTIEWALKCPRIKRFGSNKLRSKLLGVGDST